MNPFGEGLAQAPQTHTKSTPQGGGPAALTNGRCHDGTSPLVTHTAPPPHPTPCPSKRHRKPPTPRPRKEHLSERQPRLWRADSGTAVHTCRHSCWAAATCPRAFPRSSHGGEKDPPLFPHRQIQHTGLATSDHSFGYRTRCSQGPLLPRTESI